MATLKKVIQAVRSSASKDPAPAQLNGYCVRDGRIVTCDGKRLCIGPRVSPDGVSSPMYSWEQIMAAAALENGCRPELTEGADGVLRWDTGQGVIEPGEGLGEMPDYQKIVPKRCEQKCFVTLSAKFLKDMAAAMIALGLPNVNMWVVADGDHRSCVEFDGWAEGDDHEHCQVYMMPMMRCEDGKVR